jgi:hypothetical protein
MTVITRTVSRPNCGSFDRFSAASAFPRSIARTIRNTRSIVTLKAITDGLKTRGITRSITAEEAYRTRYSAKLRYPKKQTRPSDQEERV